MKELAAYLMLVLGGNATPSAADVKSALSAVGVEGCDDAISQVISSLEGKDIDSIVEAGKKKLQNVGGGGAAPAAGGAAPAAAGGAAEKKEEKKKEEEEEEEVGGAGGLFGGDDDW